MQSPKLKDNVIKLFILSDQPSKIQTCEVHYHTTLRKVVWYMTKEKLELGKSLAFLLEK